VIVTNAAPNPYGWRYVVDGRPVVTLSKEEQAAYDKMTAEQRKAAFLADLRDVMRRHDALLIAYGCLNTVYIGGYGCGEDMEIDLPYTFDADTLSGFYENEA